MKRPISLFLALLTAFSMLFLNVSAKEEKAAYPFDTKDLINLSDTGFTPGPNSGHGNHQTRTVHTSHGDYCAYITGSYSSAKGTVDTWSLFKVDAESGTSKVIFTGEKYYDSSQVSLLVDKDENVWAVTATSDNGRSSSTEALDCRAYRLDAATGEITSYTAIVSGGARDGYGYGTSFYDPVNDRIIAVFAGGDYKSGSETGASLNWAVFNLSNNRWLRSAYYQKIPARHCYMYGYVDDRGGLMLIAQRDIKCISLGYSEIGHDNGITQDDRDYMWDNYIFRWSANYCWDELDLYYIPDARKSEVFTYNVVEADYSRVKGTAAQRETFEYRLSNYYPQNQNNNGGDFLAVKTADGRTLLHITYNTAYIQAAMYRPAIQESTWYHQVWDITDPTAPEKIYNAPITTERGVADGALTNGCYSFRLYEGEDSRVYLISVFDPETEKVYYKDGATKYETQYDALLSVYKINESNGTYSYYKLPKTLSLPGGGSILNISSHRGGSVKDNTVNLLYMNNDGNGDYIFGQIDLSDIDAVLGDINDDGFINAKDSNILKQCLSGVYAPEEQGFVAADVTMDNSISGYDANLLSKYLTGAILSFEK